MDRRESKLRERLWNAVDAADTKEKNYHVRQALQLLMGTEKRETRSAAEPNDRPTAETEALTERTD